MAKVFAGVLERMYGGLLEEGIPDELASLVHRVETERPRETQGRRVAIVVESEPEVRALAAMLLDETELYIIECASAEAALAVLQREGDRVAFLFAAEELAGPRSGQELATAVRKLWPGAHVVVTTDRPSPDLPADVVRLDKPWRGLDVLIEAERAMADVSKAPAVRPRGTPSAI